MANIASAKKRIRSNNRRTIVNKNRISTIRTHVKNVEKAILSGKKKEANEALRTAESHVMTGVGKGKVNKNAMSRKISRLNKRIKDIKS